MKRKIFILFAAAVCLQACHGTGFTTPEAGTWYTTSYNGEDCWFMMDMTGEDAETGGRYYIKDTDSTATGHDFTARLNKRKVILDSDGRTVRIPRKRLKISEYKAPGFTQADRSMYRRKFCDVKYTDDIVYGHAKGYWTSLPGVEAEVAKAFTEGYVKSFRHRNLPLTLDLYQPVGMESPRPLIVFIHGGAFYVGDKQEPAYRDFCNYFAQRGYVTASINYRMGFHLGKGEIERAGYVALQDAHAAIRFLVSKAGEYGIDPEVIFVAGSSAGSITALNLAFMAEDDRPESSHGGRGIFNGNDLGRIDASGNHIKADFKVKAVANMWGAVNDTDILSNSRTDIISFHGDADNVVPYAEGYPFSSAGEAISQMLSDKMYGSACIDSTARAQGLRSEMYPFHGLGHAFNTTGKDKQPNAYHTFIKEKITDFFWREIQPYDATIVGAGHGRYGIGGKVSSSSWKVEGGFVTAEDKDGIEVVWMDDAKDWKITASGRYPSGAGYVATMSVR